VTNIIGQIIEAPLWSFVALMWVRFVFDWVQNFARAWSPRGALLVFLELTYSVTDPPIKALRRVLPPLRLGAMAIDLSPMIVLLGAWLLLVLNRMLFGI
jgi:YggT family protein